MHPECAKLGEKWDAYDAFQRSETKALHLSFSRKLSEPLSAGDRKLTTCLSSPCKNSLYCFSAISLRPYRRKKKSFTNSGKASTFFPDVSTNVRKDALGNTGDHSGSQKISGSRKPHKNLRATWASWLISVSSRHHKIPISSWHRKSTQEKVSNACAIIRQQRCRPAIRARDWHRLIDEANQEFAYIFDDGTVTMYAVSVSLPHLQTQEEGAGWSRWPVLLSISSASTLSP